jgi:hypothetical protein
MPRVEERAKKREEKRAVSLQLTWTQEPRNSVRQTSGPCINSEDVTIIWAGCKHTVCKNKLKKTDYKPNKQSLCLQIYVRMRGTSHVYIALPSYRR